MSGVIPLTPFYQFSHIMTRRLKKSETTPEAWQAHRKLRKKIASAKWYAKKKDREIREQHEHRRKLEAEYQAREAAKAHRIWPDPVQRAYWRCVVEHHVHGYPPRPDSVPDPREWLRRVDAVEARIQATRDALRGVEWARYVPWNDDRGFVKILRQLGMRSGPGTEWMTGPKGVLLAGCVRRWGKTRGAIDTARAVCQSMTDQPIQAQPTAMAIGEDIHHTVPAPTHTPHQKLHHSADIQRWIVHTLFPAPTMTNEDGESWYDSEDEEQWLREWNRLERDEDDPNASYIHTRPVPPAEEDDSNPCDVPDEDSCPSSLDHYFHDDTSPRPRHGTPDRDECNDDNDSPCSDTESTQS